MIILLLALAAQDVPLEVDVTDPSAHKIVLLAGGFSKGGGEHEYFAGSVLLFNLLQQTKGVAPVLAKEWPKNEAIFDGARTIVFYMDGIGKQPTARPEKMAKIEALAAKGVGIVHLHQVI